MELADGSVRKRRRAYDLPRVAHELTWTCYRRLRLLGQERTRQWLIDAMDRARRVHDLALLAYVVMPEHVHVLVWSRRDPYTVASILKSIKQPVARRAIAHLRVHGPAHLERLRVARTDGRIEHRFWHQGGGYDRNLLTRKSIAFSINYIHNNPVRRGLCARPVDWRWSSAAAYRGEPSGPLAVERWG